MFGIRNPFHRRPAELSVHISFSANGFQSVSIHGGTTAQAGQLMAWALLAPHGPAAPAAAPVLQEDRPWWDPENFPSAGTEVPPGAEPFFPPSVPERPF